jgi:hypothetical protein
MTPLIESGTMPHDREAQFAIVDKIRSSVPVYPADEVDADIAQAVEAARAETPLIESGKLPRHREARFAAFQRSIQDRPRYPEAEVEADIGEAVAIVRGQRAAERTGDPRLK